MLQRVRDFFNTYLLVELWKGLRVTGGNMFARKVTVHFPEEKTPQSAPGANAHLAIDSLQPAGRSSIASTRSG